MSNLAALISETRTWPQRLAAFPSIEGMTGISLYAAAMGLAGGIVTVVFFAAWSQLFGRGQLGRIQGTAQLTSVLASALGPVLMARYQAATGTYLPLFYLMAIGMGVLALAACFVPLPRQAFVAARQFVFVDDKNACEATAAAQSCGCGGN